MKNQRLVSLVKGEDRQKNIYRCLELIKADLSPIREKRKILIKPNLTASRNKYANTDKSAVEAILDFLSDFDDNFINKEVTILEGSGSAYYEGVSTEEVFEQSGYYDLMKKFKNLHIESIDNFRDFINVKIQSIAGEEQVRIVKRIEDFDYKISVNLPKTHNYAIATLGIKNMAGLIKQEDKSLVHGLRTPSAPDAKTVFTHIPTAWIAWARRRFPRAVDAIFKHSSAYSKAMKVIHHNIAEIAKLTWPDLVVIDGFTAMEGRGPIDGDPVKLEVAIASADPLKADGIASRVIGLEPQDIGYLFYLNQMGWGDYSLNGLVGDDLNKVRKKIKLHPTFKIQKDWMSE